MNQYDIVAIGDTVVDVFIRLVDAQVNCTIDHQSCQLCMKFGDKLPYESAEVIYAVGNSANASVSAARLGLASALISTVGNDQNGKACFDALAENKVSTEYVATSNDFPTNYHYVLCYEAERTILIKHEPFPYVLPDFKTPPRWIYLSSVSEQSLPFHKVIADYVRAHPETKLAFQPGTFQMKFGIEALKDIYQLSETFFCNVEEAQRILNEKSRDVKMLMARIHELGPKIVCVTDGPAGAYASDGTNSYFMPIYPDPAPPQQRTGCGDAFASTFVSMLAKGKTFEEALRIAPINPMNVVQHVGAQKGLMSEEEVMEWLAKAPADYQPKKI